jgi:pimeloyl-ACP methyl ester carboxylesterase
MAEPHEVMHHEPNVNGIRYHYAEAGDGPLVLLLHGFPELWYSWRHQLSALAGAGYHAVAPDLRGFGRSEVTTQVEDYGLLHHAEDVKALVDHLGERETVLVGHDWGANLTWAMALLHPTMVKAVVALSIPFYPRPRDPAEMKQFSKGHFNFVEWTEVEFQQNPRRFFRKLFYGLSGDAPAGTLERVFLGKPSNEKSVDGFPAPTELPHWLTEDDIDYYVSSFQKTGIWGAMGFYHNMENDHRELQHLYQRSPHQPTLFVGGADEPAVRFGSLEPMKSALPNLRTPLLIPGCGHWVQQERPDEVNAAIIPFLNGEREQNTATSAPTGGVNQGGQVRSNGP